MGDWILWELRSSRTLWLRSTGTDRGTSRLSAAAGSAQTRETQWSWQISTATLSPTLRLQRAEGSPSASGLPAGHSACRSNYHGLDGASSLETSTATDIEI